MGTTARAGFIHALVLCSAVGCSSAPIDDRASDGDGGAGSAPVTEALELTVGPDSRTFVELGTSAQVEINDSGERSIGWDIALQARDVFTNGGVSGPGSSSAFGPLSAPTYLSDTAPEVPLLLQDRAGGALLGWYDYAGATHELLSRYHVYGLRDGERLFKLQVLGYYGEQLGTPVTAVYHVRYAEVTASGLGELHEVSGIDATAGGSPDDASQPSACLELDTEEVSALTPDEAAQSESWQLCFRRESIAVNGGLSGPRGVTAVDLQAADSADETEAEIKARTPESERALFEGVDFAALSAEGLDYRADGVVTAFGQRWLEPGSDPPVPSDAVWLVIGADGASKYLLRFSELSADPAREQAKLTLEAKSVR